MRSGEVWSAGYQPSGVEPDSYEVAFSEDRAEIVRRDGTLTTTLEVAVSPEDDAEVRRVSLSNLGSRAREIELTSYAEVVLAPPAADAAHPAFSKLFVQTEFVADVGALLATRRRRSPDEPEVWAAHLAVVEGESVGGMQFETDRARFLGRGTDDPDADLGDRRPAAVGHGRAPCSIRSSACAAACGFRRAPRCASRSGRWSRRRATKRSTWRRQASTTPTAFERAVTLAWTQAQVQLHHLGVGPDEAHLFQRLANHVLYSDPTLRPASEVLGRSQRGPSTLWAHGISGDLPIVLVRIDDVEDLEIVRQLLRAHEYWRMKQLAVDLVILNERHTSYAQDLQASLEALVRASQSRTHADGEGARGALFVLRSDLVSLEARACCGPRRGRCCSAGAGASPSRSRRPDESEHRARRRARVRSPARGTPEPAPPRPALEFFNGLGGFASAGREYVTILGEGQWTPAPWINVIANPAFGFQVSAEGGGYTWSGNSRENQLTPWSNDPVGDRPGEVFYVRDEDTRHALGPDGPADPRRGRAIRRPARPGLQPLRAHLARDRARAARSTCRPTTRSRSPGSSSVNRSARTRRLSVTAYVEWVLAAAGRSAAPFIVTEIDAETGALLARNPWSTSSADAWPSWTSLGDRWRGPATGRSSSAATARSITRPRSTVVPRSRIASAPASILVASLQARLELRPHARAEIVCFLGEASTLDEARALLTRYRGGRPRRGLP